MSEQYFKNLNYSMSNEDSEFEYALLPENSGHVLSICGSGSRVVPLLAKKPKKLTLVDYSSEQLAITQLRIAAIKQLDYNQYLQFLGYQDGMKTNSRYQIFMDLDLPENSRAYLTKFFEQHEWSAPLYLGNYEKALIKMSKIIRFTLGKHIQKLQKIKNQNEFLHYLETDFPLKRWKLLVFILGNSTFLNAILYKGNHPNKNIEQS